MEILFSPGQFFLCLVDILFIKESERSDNCSVYTKHRKRNCFNMFEYYFSIVEIVIIL